MACVKKKRVPEGSRERNIHHANAMKALSQNFGSANNFYPKNLEGDPESTKYTDMQSEYVVNLAKIKVLEARIMAFDMRDPFIISTLVDEHAGAAEDRWGDCEATGVYLLYHWFKVLILVVAQFQRDYYEYYSDDDDIISCEWTKELFINP